MEKREEHACPASPLGLRGEKMSFSLEHFGEALRSRHETFRGWGRDHEVYLVELFFSTDYLLFPQNGTISWHHQEAQTNTVILVDDDPLTVERMLTFLYTREYDDEAPAQIEEPVATSKDALGSMLDDDGHWTSSFAISENSARAAVDGKETDRVLSVLDLSRALINIAVYAIAEKYNLEDLKKAARVRCLSQTWASWPLDDLRIIAKEVYSSTPSSDRGLRDKVISDCADHAQELTEHEDWISLTKMDGDLAFDLFQKMTKKHTGAILEVANSRSQAIDLLGKKVELLQENDELQQAMVNFDLQLDEALENAKDTDGCRHCSSSFDSYLERRGRSSAADVKLVQRCKKCRTRHAL